MQCFIEGKCPKCGGHMYSSDTEKPMKCMRCGAKYRLSDKLKEFLEGHNKEDSKDG